MTDRIISEQIFSLDNYRPSAKVDFLFSNLVNYACNPLNQITISDESRDRLCNISEKAEYEMELDFARRFLESKDSELALEDFKYYLNYKTLVNLEVSNTKILLQPKKILFVGGGPLPLSAIILARDYNFDVTILECDRIAFDFSHKIIDKLKTKNITILNQDAYDYKLYQEHDLIYFAALVSGEYKSRLGLINSTYDKLNQGSVILCRSAHDARCLLYNNINKKDLIKYPTLEVIPYNDIVNSFLILQK